MLKKTMRAGILVFCKKNKLSTLYKLRKSVHTISANETVDVWLGTSSNKAGSARPITIPDDSTWNVLAVVNKEDLPEGMDLAIGQMDLKRTKLC